MRLRRTPKERRDAPRTPVAWEGRYGRSGQPEWEWLPCSVHDVSGGGARIVAPAPTAVRAGDGVTLSVDRLGSTWVGITLHGRVAHVTTAEPASDDDATALSVGIALDFTSPQDRRVAASLFART
ncbi:MAG: PilZ domain-containing protein [Acidimicrobiia bacterium]